MSLQHRLSTGLSPTAVDNSVAPSAHARAPAISQPTSGSARRQSSVRSSRGLVTPSCNIVGLPARPPSDSREAVVPRPDHEPAYWLPRTDTMQRTQVVAPSASTETSAAKTRCKSPSAVAVAAGNPIAASVADELPSPNDVLIRTLFRASEAGEGSVRQEASRKIQGADDLTGGKATPACSWRSSIPTQQAGRPAPSPSPTALSPP